MKIVASMCVEPDCHTITRTVDVGGLTKSQLLLELQRHSISMNESGERLFADDRFTTSHSSYKLNTVELTVRDLGFAKGANSAKITYFVITLDVIPVPP